MTKNESIESNIFSNEDDVLMEISNPLGIYTRNKSFVKQMAKYKPDIQKNNDMVKTSVIEKCESDKKE